MSFWGGFASGLNAGSRIRDGWDERGGFNGLFGGERAGAGDGATARAPVSEEVGRPASPAPRPDTGGSGAETSSNSSPGEPLDLTQYMRRTRTAESGGDDSAQARTSSASGRYQFIDSTWRQMMRQHPELNLTAGGRFDPAQQERAMRQFTLNNAAELRRQGLPVTNGNLYAMHFFGSGDAPRVIRADPNTPLSQIVSSSSIVANRFLAGRTAGWARDWTVRKVGGEAVTAGRTTRAPASGNADDAPEPIRVRPGEMSITSMFNDVPADAAQRVSSNPEMEELITATGGLAGSQAPASDNSAAQRRAVVDQMWQSRPRFDYGTGPEATPALAAAPATAPATPEGRAPVGPSGRVQEQDNPPGPMTTGSTPAARPAAGSAPTSAPVPLPRPTEAGRQPAGRATGGLSERDRVMLLRDEQSLPPGEAERLRAGLPAGTSPLALFGLGMREASAASAPRQMSAPVPQPRPQEAAAAPAAPVPQARPAAASAPAAGQETQGPFWPSGNVQEQDNPSGPFHPPAAQLDAERYAAIRSQAQTALDRGDAPARVARRLAQAGIPEDQWPAAIRPAQRAVTGLGR